MTQSSMPWNPGDAVDTLPLDDRGNLVADVPCRSCGYNLRGIKPEGVCPECGLPLLDSIRGEFLRFCDPSWVEQLAKGTRWIGVATVLFLILWGAGVLLGIVEEISASRGATSNELPAMLAAALNVMTLIPALLLLVGVWRATTPEPQPNASSGGQVARILARYSWLASIAMIPVIMVLELATESFGSNTSGNPTQAEIVAAIAAGVVVVACLVSYAIGFIALLIHARRLALRVPDNNLAWHTRIVMWGLACSCGFFILALLASLGLAMGGLFFDMMVGIGIGSCMFAVAFLVFFIWLLVLVFRYRQVMMRSAEAARATCGARAG